MFVESVYFPFFSETRFKKKKSDIVIDKWCAHFKLRKTAVGILRLLECDRLLK